MTAVSWVFYSILIQCVCAGELKADINQTLEAFEHILLLYKSGLHLDNLPPSIIGGKR